MSIIADGLLIATCLTAAVYCFVLARRLKQFSNTEEGIGQQILQLTTTLQETRTALKEAQAGAKTETEALAREVLQARKLSTQLRNQLDAAAGAVGNSRKAPVSEASEPEQPVSVDSAPIPPQSFVAAAAVQVDDSVTDQPAPDVSDPEESVDPASIDVNALLAASAGEQQLGFLPDEDDFSDETDSEPAAPESEKDDAASLETASDVADSDTDDAPMSAEIASSAEAGNLLKVERMAL